MRRVMVFAGIVVFLFLGAIQMAAFIPSELTEVRSNSMAEPSSPLMFPQDPCPDLYAAQFDLIFVSSYLAQTKAPVNLIKSAEAPLPLLTQPFLIYLKMPTTPPWGGASNVQGCGIACSESTCQSDQTYAMTLIGVHGLDRETQMASLSDALNVVNTAQNHLLVFQKYAVNNMVPNTWVGTITPSVIGPALTATSQAATAINLTLHPPGAAPPKGSTGNPTTPPKPTPTPKKP